MNLGFGMERLVADCLSLLINVFFYYSFGFKEEPQILSGNPKVDTRSK